MQYLDCTTFHFLWCLRIASFGAVTRRLRSGFINSNGVITALIILLVSLTLYWVLIRITAP